MRRWTEWAFQTPERAMHGNGPIVTGEHGEGEARRFADGRPGVQVFSRTVEVSDWVEGA